MPICRGEWKNLSDRELKKEIRITQRLLEVVSCAAPSSDITLLKRLCSDRLSALRSEQRARFAAGKVAITLALLGEKQRDEALSRVHEPISEIGSASISSLIRLRCWVA
jgi:hypothetical protein